MRKSTGLLPALLVAIASEISTASPSLSAPITYTFENTASGSLGGVAFTNADVVFRMTGDTTKVTGGSNVGTGGTVSVAGGAPAIITDLLRSLRPARTFS